MSHGIRYGWAGVVLLLAIAAAMLMRQIRQSERAAAALNLATERKEQARQRVKLAEQKLARAERERGAGPAGAPLAAGASAPAPAAATASAKAAAETNTGGTMKLSMQKGTIRPEVAEATDPELRALSLQVFDAQFDGVWGPLLQQLNLSEEKAAALKALLRTHEERRMDVTAVAGEQGLELSDPAIQKLRNADGARLNREALALLGPDDAKTLQQFRREMRVYSTIKDLAAENFSTSTPLTSAESQQLRTILAGNSERLSNGFVRPDSVNWAAALPQIERSGAFSAASIEGLRRVVAEQQVHQQISRLWDEIGNQIMGPGPRGEFSMPRFPALQPKPWTGAATIPKAH